MLLKSDSSWQEYGHLNGTILAFFADIDGAARLCLWFALNRNLNIISDIIARPFFGFEKPIWTKDGGSVIIKSMPDNGFNSFSKTGHNQNSSNSKPKVFTTMGNTVEEKEKNQQSWVNIYRADIVMIDIETEASTILSSGLRPVGMALANDGEHIVFTSCLGEEKKNTQQNVFDLWISPLKTKERHGEQQCIAERIRMNYGMSFSWSHNDQSIYYSTTGPLSDGSLWLVDLASSNQKRLYEQKDISFGRDYEGPFPMSNGAILMVANGDLWCYFSLTGHIEKFTLPRERKVTAILPEGNQSGTNVIVQTSDPAEALDGFWRVNYTTGETEKIVED
ncbi:hypothetical protein [Lentibacillus sp. CBA3610]|uniref:hypothetical protein n=1 Tax=Lentibacillus sp. CBA3610 TaxID=2518176 RepID=UPI001595FDE8|nr:hypothetical protein [Lentibacillus sp. CBA3610]QKY70556.1 hypothetical protein Len3610_14015 [Lentibacillus sp. CBA3610]